MGRQWLAVVLLLGLGASVFGLATEGNDFPAFFHPDESSKASQIRNPSRLNYNHPLLLLEGTFQVARYKGLTPGGLFFNPTEEQILACGRLASAIFVTVGAIAVALAGYRMAGLIGLVTAGALYGLSPQLILYGHYMKEDGALAMGISLVILAVVLLLTNRHWYLRYLYAALLGLAVATAASGKAAGAASVIPAALALILAPTPDLKRWSYKCIDALPRMVMFALAAALTVVTINHRAFTFASPVYAGVPQLKSPAQRGIEGEINHAREGHTGVALVKPNTYFLRTTLELTTPTALASLAATMPVLGIMAGIQFAGGLRRRRERRATGAEHSPPLIEDAGVEITAEPSAEHSAPVSEPASGPVAGSATGSGMGLVPAPTAYWTTPLHLTALGVVIAMFITFTVGLSYFNAIPFKRYALPMVLSLHAMSALVTGVVLTRLSAFAPGSSKLPAQLLAGITPLLLLALAVPRALDIPRQFRSDSRIELRTFLATLPPGTRVLTDGYAYGRFRLPNTPTLQRNVSIIDAGMVPRLGSVENLAQRGFTYAVVCELNYDRFTDPDIRPQGNDAGFAAIQKTYRQLLALPAEWESGTRHPTRSFTNPHIKVVKLPPAPQATKR